MSRSLPLPFLSRSARLEVCRLPDAVIAVLASLAGLILYGATAAPSVAVLFDDTLEFQVVIPTLGIAHPSGYPLYTLLGKLFTEVVPWRDPAGRLNLLSAVLAAAAIGCYYLAAARWARHRVPAMVATVAFALAPAWWAQATLAEVYALNGLLVALFLYLLLRWEDAALLRQRGADSWLAAAALVMGLGLAHHRMIALLLPAALVFILWTDPAILRQPARWWRPVAYGLAPLLLYLYLPIRGQAVTSLDGTFQPTAGGTLDWILARAYTVFLTGNPFNVHRDAGTFVGLFREQLGDVVLLAAALGVATAWRFERRRFVFLLLATVAQVAFGVAYKVQDVAVFLLPAFMLAGLWAASGISVLLDSTSAYLAGTAGRWQLSSRVRPWLLGGWAGLVAVLVLVGPVQAAVRALPAQDRSQAWDVYDYGTDMLASVAPGGRVIGLGGEITLLRYFRDVLGQRPDVGLVRADGERERLQAVLAAQAEGVPTYLTRDLPGAASRYSLDSAGPLIRVSSRAAPGPAAHGRPAGGGITLIDAQAVVQARHGGQLLRVQATWTAASPITETMKISARVLDAGGQQVAQNDVAPVHFAYGTPAWVPGEEVDDVYDVPLPLGAVPPFKPVLILYRADNGQEVGRVELPPVAGR